MIGQTIAHYRITAKLGEGGMGAVYRATDTKLGRDVAVKVLPDSFAQDPDRMVRFEREAQVLASLNHPNIAAIYGVEDRALIMELVEGEDLAGPVPVNKAIDYARQITDALSAAHDKGIIHRDLKPANIKITPDGVVKVLDFGLAKATDLTKLDTTIDPVNSPTVVAGTMAGVIMGTAAYMAPEQARGQAVDKRADIWAFGVVLFEMLTGKPLFNGETVSDTLASVMKDEIDFSKLPKNTPPNVTILLTKCLQRDRKNRLRDLGDAWLELPAAVAPRRTSLLPWALLGAVIFLSAIALWKPWLKPSAQPVLHFDIDTGGEDVSQPAISPDGSQLAFVSGGRLNIRRFDQPAALPLSGTEGASYPFFSTDGQWLAFFSGAKLHKISAGGGAVITLCDAPSGRGGSWYPDGSIVAALNTSGGLTRIPVNGGPATPVTEVKMDAVPILSHRWPQVLPEGRGVLYTVFDVSGSLRVQPAASGQAKVLIENTTYGRYVSTGHLLYHQQGSIYAAPFSLERLELTGPAQPLVHDVATLPSPGFAEFDVSTSGTLVYKLGFTARRIISWIDASGKTQPLPLKPGFYGTPSLSQDGNRLALTIERNIWVYDIARDILNRVTFDGPNRIAPIWSPDSEYLAFSDGGARGSLAWIRSTGGTAVEHLAERSVAFPSSFSPDGHWIAFHKPTPESDLDPWIAPVSREGPAMRVGAPKPLFREKGNQIYPRVSPDGRWIAYQSNESGRMEIFVIPFSSGAAGSGKWQISSEGGALATWSRSGRELFFLNPERRIMVAPYTTSAGSFVADKPRVWSDRQLTEIGNFPSFDVAPDGNRIIAILDETEAKPVRHLRVMLNVDHELRRKGPNQ
jgi:serine/threonine protein kinase